MSAAAAAIRASARSVIVSIKSASGPSKASARACCENASLNCSAFTSFVSSIFPLGPIDANTIAESLAACREIFTAARLMASTCPCKPYGARLTLFARNVFVRITRLPA